MKFKIIVLRGHPLSEWLATDCIAAAAKHGHKLASVEAATPIVAEDYLQRHGLTAAHKKAKLLGVRGCFVSHYRLWCECAGGDETFAIFEHDGYLLRSIPPDIETAFETVLKLDRLDHFEPDYQTLLESEIGLPVTIEPYVNRLALPDRGVGNYFRGSFAYLIKPAGAQRLLSSIALHGFYPSDIQLNERVLGELHATKPTLARLHPFFTNAKRIAEYSTTRNFNKIGA